MSMVFIKNNLISTFREYLLSESIKPKFSDYGIDIENNFKDNKWTEVGRSKYTFSKINNKFYAILILYMENGVEIAFAAGDKPSIDLKDYNSKRTETQNILSVFSKLIFIFFKGINENIKNIYFESANPALGSAYDKIIKNKYFLASLKEYGFVYKEKNDDFYIFNRE